MGSQNAIILFLFFVKTFEFAPAHVADNCPSTPRTPWSFPLGNAVSASSLDV